jgi:dUTP pyrophosphatase
MKIKLLSEFSKVPTRANPTDAGADLYSIENVIVPPLERKLISTGISVKIPDGHYGRIAPRSGLAYKNGIDVLAGVIDSEYTGEIKVILYNTDKNNYHKVSLGDKIAQIIIEKHYNFDFELVDELDQTDRGIKGFGSSGQ